MVKYISYILEFFRETVGWDIFIRGMLCCFLSFYILYFATETYDVSYGFVFNIFNSFVPSATILMIWYDYKTTTKNNLSELISRKNILTLGILQIFIWVIQSLLIFLCDITKVKQKYEQSVYLFYGLLGLFMNMYLIIWPIFISKVNNKIK